MGTSRKLSLLLAIIGAAACGGHDHGDEVGPPTGAECPTSSTLTWDTFGQEFMNAYCTQCHSSELTGDARNGAPLYHDFDTVEGVRAVAAHVDQKAGAGPDSTNELMPPAGETQPSLAERQQLAEWLACGAP